LKFKSNLLLFNTLPVLLLVFNIWREWGSDWGWFWVWGFETYVEVWFPSNEVEVIKSLLTSVTLMKELLALIGLMGLSMPLVSLTLQALAPFITLLLTLLLPLTLTWWWPLTFGEEVELAHKSLVEDEFKYWDDEEDDAGEDDDDTGAGGVSADADDEDLDNDDDLALIVLILISDAATLLFTDLLLLFSIWVFKAPPSQVSFFW
jgi:hypothetical protein